METHKTTKKEKVISKKREKIQEKQKLAYKGNIMIPRNNIYVT